MKSRSANKTDLIISMTLAEIFLLILFVVWYSQGAGAGPEWERIAKDRQTQIENLKSHIDDQAKKIADLEKVQEFWRNSFGVSPPASIDELKALQPKGLAFIPPGSEQSSTSGRSNLTPKCSELGLKDVLFGTVIRGRDLYELNGQTDTFDQVQSAYASDLQEARKKDCRYVIDVSYQEVKTDDFVYALRRLRSVYYVQFR